MARDAGGTREQLLRAGERLFARHGIHGVSVREITELAGQRNASAIHYHFGSRDGLLEAINERHLTPMDVQRSAMVEALETAGNDRDVRALVETIVVPMAAGLHTPAGRDYLRIVPQLLEHAGVRGHRGTGRTGKATPQQTRNLEHLASALDHLDEGLRRERIAIILTMITGALGDRARDVERGHTNLVDEELFVSNLIDMSVAALEAPEPRQMRESHHGVRTVPAGLSPGTRRARSRARERDVPSRSRTREAG